MSNRFLLCMSCWIMMASAQTGFRPPAVPLVTHDPYFSIWSTADRLTDEPTRHWTGAVHSLVALVRVDGETLRVAGTLPRAQFAPLPQTGLEVWPTRTIYRFAGQGIALALTFLTPALPADLDILSRPASYIAWKVNSTDGRQHDVSLYLDASKELAVNIPQQRVVWGRFFVGRTPGPQPAPRPAPFCGWDRSSNRSSRNRATTSVSIGATST